MQLIHPPKLVAVERDGRWYDGHLPAWYRDDRWQANVTDSVAPGMRYLDMVPADEGAAAGLRDEWPAEATGTCLSALRRALPLTPGAASGPRIGLGPSRGARGPGPGLSRQPSGLPGAPAIAEGHP